MSACLFILLFYSAFGVDRSFGLNVVKLMSLVVCVVWGIVLIFVLLKKFFFDLTSSYAPLYFLQKVSKPFFLRLGSRPSWVYFCVSREITSMRVTDWAFAIVCSLFPRIYVIKSPHTEDSFWTPFFALGSGLEFVCLCTATVVFVCLFVLLLWLCNRS